MAGNDLIEEWVMRSYLGDRARLMIARWRRGAGGGCCVVEVWRRERDRIDLLV